jgi:phage gpG-like protein
MIENTFSILITQPELTTFALSERWRARVLQRFTEYMLRSERFAKQLVSGPVLHVRTNRLRSSITSSVEVEGHDLVGRLGTDVVYAAIHEFGGTIPAHRIYARRAQALHWFPANLTGLAVSVGLTPKALQRERGAGFFAKYVDIPTVHMPERAYLRPSLQQNLGWLQDVLIQDSGTLTA